MLSKTFHLFLCGFVFFIHTAEGQYELEGDVGEPLNFSCEISNSSQAKYISLKVDSMELQNFDLKNNQSHCVVNNPSYNRCITQMNKTQRMVNLVMFMVKKAWQELDGKSFQCFTRYDSYNQDTHGPIRNIKLQDRNLSVNGIPTISPTSVTIPDTGQRNVTNDTNDTNVPNVPAKKDNTKTFSIGDMVGAFFGGFGFCFLVLALAFLAFRLYKKYHKPVNGNNPSQDQNQNGNVERDSSATQGENVPLQDRGI